MWLSRSWVCAEPGLEDKTGWVAGGKILPAHGYRPRGSD
jgi:hypothetical protein